MKNNIVKIKRKRNLGKTLFIYGGLAWPIIHFIVFWFCMNIGMVYNSFFTETINGVTCQVYQERYDDDRERIWVQQVGSNYIVWQKQEDRDDREILIEMSIASL